MTRLLRVAADGELVEAEALSFSKMDWAKHFGEAYQRELSYADQMDDDEDGDEDGHEQEDSDGESPLLEVSPSPPAWAGSEALRSNERALQALIALHPEIIPWEGLYGGGNRATLVAREFRGIDLLFLVCVDSEWRFLVMETKLVSNPELLRQVVAQVVAYAARLWKSALIEPKFEKRLRKSAKRYWQNRGTTLEAQLTSRLSEHHEEHWAAAVKAAKDGKVLSLIVADQLPDDLRTILGFLPASVLLRAVRVEPVRVNEGAIIAATPIQADSTGASAADRVKEWMGTKLDLRLTEVGLRTFGGGPIVVAADPPQRKPPRIPPTIINAATAELQKAAGDLISGGSIGIPTCFEGFSVGSVLRTESIDKMKMRIRFDDFCHDIPEGEKGRIRINFYVRGHQQQVAAVELKKELAGETELLRELLGVPVTFVEDEKGLTWIVRATVIPQPWTPESLAEWMVKIYRHFTGRLPSLRARKAPSKPKQTASAA